MFQYTPYILPLLVSAIMLIALIGYGWFQRKHKVAVYFSLMMSAVTIWVVFAILELLAVELELRIFLAKVDFIGITYLAPLLLLMALEYLGKTQQMRNLLFASVIIPTLTNILIWTNDWHRLWYGTPSLDTSGAPFVVTNYDYGAWFYLVHAPFGWITIIFVLTLLLRKITLKKTVYRDQILVFLLAILLPTITDVFYVFGITPIPQFNFTPIVFSLSGIIIAWALYRYKFLDLVPVARDIIFKNIGDMILVIDLQQRVVDVNAITEEIINKTPHELIGLPISDVFPNQIELIKAYIDAEEIESEISLENDDKQQYFNLKVSPLKQEEQLIGHLIVIRDISSQKELVEREKQLALEQLRSNLQYQLITHVTHDLITPITIMKSSIYVARKTKDDEKRQQKLENIANHVDRLQRMLEDMLLMSKVDMMSDLSCERISLQQLFRNLLAPYKEAILEKKQRLSVQICDGDLFIDVNHEYLAMAISRLLDNALQYTPEEGHIDVAIECEANQLGIEIKDNGIGISSDELSTIFERFYRSASHRPTDAGSGLGLSIARQIVELHGGEISVHSILGEGSTFKITVPVIITEA